MPIYPRKIFHISQDASSYLPTLFAGPRAHSNSPHTSSGFISAEGYVVVNQSPGADADGTHSISHSLNILAQLYDLDTWQDSRTTHQIRSCEEQAQVPIFSTLKEAKEHFDIYGHATGKALWSNHVPIEQTIHGDQSYQFKYTLSLKLSPGALQYYSKLAGIHRMESLALKHKHSTGNAVASCLEAIGSSWLSPPAGYRLIISCMANPNYSSVHSRRRKLRQDNLDRFAPGQSFKWRPVTTSNINEIVAELEEWNRTHSTGANS